MVLLKQTLNAFSLKVYRDLHPAKAAVRHIKGKGSAGRGGKVLVNIHGKGCSRRLHVTTDPNPINMLLVAPARKRKPRGFPTERDIGAVIRGAFPAQKLRRCSCRTIPFESRRRPQLPSGSWRNPYLMLKARLA